MQKQRQGTRSNTETADALMGDAIAEAITKALRKAGRLPGTRRIIVQHVEYEADNGKDMSALAPGYPAEFKQLRIESVFWTIKCVEVLR